MVLGVVIDPKLATTKGLLLMVLMFISFFSTFFVMITGSAIDKKVNGKGRYSAEFKGVLSSEQKNLIYEYFNKLGYSKEEKDGLMRFMKQLGFGGGYISISNDNGFVLIEVYALSLSNYTQGKESGLYGINAILFKRRLRKVTAGLLNLINAPDNIRV